MVNVIIKNEDARLETEKILRDFHKDARTATPEQCDSAEYIARKVREIREENRK